MTQFAETHHETIPNACRDNASGIAESLNCCLDGSYQLSVSDSQPFPADSATHGIDGPGLIVALEVGDQAFLALIPQSLPLPEWYTAPDQSQHARLQTLAMEWSMQLLPDDLEAGKSASIAVVDLKEAISRCEPSADAQLLVFNVSSTQDASDSQAASSPDSDESSAEATDDAGEDDGQPTDETATAKTQTDADSSEDPSKSTGNIPESAAIYLVWPVAHLPQDQEMATESGQPDVDGVGSNSDKQRFPGSVTHADSESAKRLAKIPVSVIVRLAEKKVEMRQLLSLAPGSLITFEKPCEDLLDLYVNDFRYCRGEAVKIGEKFGLKINKVGVVEEYESKIVR
jgi:flagellar motor switch protein FliN/FliY